MRIWALNARLGNSAYKFCSPDGKSLDLLFCCFLVPAAMGMLFTAPDFLPLVKIEISTYYLCLFFSTLYLKTTMDKLNLKKQFGRYTIEFLLLFSAVTLGFFAENYREGLVERKTEKMYLQSLIKDFYFIIRIDKQ